MTESAKEGPATRAPFWDRWFDERLDATAVRVRHTFWPRIAAVAGTAILFGLNLGWAAGAIWFAIWCVTEAWVWRSATIMAPPRTSSFGKRLNYAAAALASTLMWSVLAFAYWRTGDPLLQVVAATCLASLLMHAASFGYRSPVVLMVQAGPPAVTWLALPAFLGGFPDLSTVTLIVSVGLMLFYVYAIVVSNTRKAAALEAANEAKSAFLAMMSHELRTPLNGVLGIARILQAAPLSPRHAASVDIIVRSGEHMISVLNDVLDVSKIEAGRLDLEAVAFDVVDAGERVVMLWAGTAADRGLSLTFDVEPDFHPWVLGDVTRVRQVMLNLVSNAIKFTDQGEVRLGVRWRDRAERAPGIEISVRDTGIGLSPAQQEKLFKPYAQAEASTARQFGGTGLGLSICRQLTELMGGTISLESTLGEGATFTVWLPLRRADPPSPAGDDAAQTLPALRVLVVDDNAINQTVAKAVLEATGAVVEIANDGADALERLRAAAFDVVVMDVRMPRMDGIEAVARIRAGEAGPPQVPVIALTGDVGGDEEARVRGLGFDALQGKPIHPAGLIGSIFEVLARHPGVALEA